MVLDFRVECELDFPADLFWTLRASKVFTSFLIRDRCLSRMYSSPARVVHPRNPNVLTRTQVYAPAAVDIPDFARAIISDSLVSVTDTQKWDENLKFRQEFSCKPSILSDFVTTGGCLRLKPKETDKSRCLHIIEGQTSVEMPCIGSLVEQAIVNNMRKFYRAYPNHISNFKTHLINTFGNGDPDNLHLAVERALDWDARQQESNGQFPDCR